MNSNSTRLSLHNSSAPCIFTIARKGTGCCAAVLLHCCIALYVIIQHGRPSSFPLHLSCRPVAGRVDSMQTVSWHLPLCRLWEEPGPVGGGGEGGALVWEWRGGINRRGRAGYRPQVWQARPSHTHLLLPLGPYAAHPTSLSAAGPTHAAHPLGHTPRRRGRTNPLHRPTPPPSCGCGPRWHPWLPAPSGRAS